MLSTFISIIVVLVVVGLLLYIVENYIPMPEPFKMVIRVLSVLFLFLYILSVLGLWNGFRSL